jgi:uncharacterized protein YgiM (DUF1202 family)
VDNAPVKRGSAMKFDTVATLKKDDEVEVLIESDPWVKVKLMARKGISSLRISHTKRASSTPKRMRISYQKPDGYMTKSLKRVTKKLSTGL